MLRIAVLACLGALLAAGSAAGIDSAPDLTEARAVTPRPASVSRVTANRVAFQDARGENPEGLDVSTVVVSSGDAGLITFRIDIPNRPVLTDDMRLRVWVDSDHKIATGLRPSGESPTGWDYFLLWDRGTGRKDPSLYRCNGARCTGGGVHPPQRTLRSSYASGPRFTILDAELGSTKRFRFSVEAADGIVVDPTTRAPDVTNAHWDYAPARGRSWSYDVRRRTVTKSSARRIG